MSELITSPLTDVETLAISAGSPPEPSSYNDILPDLTPPLLNTSETMDTSEVYLYGFQQGGGSRPNTYIVGSVAQLGTITPAWPSKVYFQYKTYWQLVGQHKLNGVKGTMSKSVSYGTSETNKYDLALTIGAQGKGLSAGLTATFSKSITVDNSTTKTDQWESGPLQPGKTCGVFAVWQLCTQFVWMDGDTGQEMKQSGYTGSAHPGFPLELKQPLLNIGKNHFVANFTQFATTD